MMWKRRNEGIRTSKSILQYLAWRHIFAWRINSGATPIEAPGGRRFVRFGVLGSPDIIAVKDGQFIGIEVKAKGKKLRDSQVEFKDKLEAAGGVYIIAYDIEDVTKAIQL
jgi:hypothetical protein